MSVCNYSLFVFRNDKAKEKSSSIRRASSQGGSLNRGVQSWGTGPPPLPKEPPPVDEPKPSPATKTPRWDRQYLVEMENR